MVGHRVVHALRVIAVLLAVCTGSVAVLGAQEAPAGSAAPRRIALLIANSAYDHLGDLAGPVPEARLLAGTLRSLGFTVTVLENAGRERMLDALADLERTLGSGGGIALLHYGGHGVQVGGKNYLVPVDADLPDERRVATRAVDVDEIMAALAEGGADTSIVILDACRDNPLPASSTRAAVRGLSVVTVKPRNSIIVYSAESGTTAIDGIFTPVLAEVLARPGLSLAEVMTEVRREVYARSGGRQTPGEYSQLFEQVYLAGASPRAPGTPVVAVADPGRAGGTPAAPVVSATFRIGDRGPAGGIVFHDKGDDAGGWRYLEAAPNDQASSMPWGGAGTRVGGTDMAVGRGEENTRAILGGLGDSASAARLCEEMVYAGFDDWFLPSKEELVLMYRARDLIGGFRSYYWSSTEDGADNAWDLTFTTGYQYSSPKTRYRAVRAIRAF